MYSEGPPSRVTTSSALVVRTGSARSTTPITVRRGEKNRLIMPGNARFVVQPCGQENPVDDAMLFQQWLDGHPHAARTMWQRFAPMVRRMLRRSLGSDVTIEDLEQEVFLSLFQRAHLLREPKALKAFVISITTRTLCREFRGRWLGRTLRWQFAYAEANTLTVHPDPESREGLRQLGGILDRFNDQDRRAFVLYCMEGMALEDVAAALHVSLATAKRRLSRVRNRVMLMARRDDALVDYLTEIDKDGACTPGIERHRLMGWDKLQHDRSR